MQPGTRLQGKVAIVTGGASGIGAETARAFAVQGASVMICDGNAALGEAVVEEISEAGGTSQFAKLDVRSEAQWAEVVAATEKAYGKVDILVNCAGIFEPQPFETQLLESFDRQMAVNVRAPFALTQAALPHLRPDGAVVNISSIAGYAGFPQSAAYCATKGAVELMTRALATELGPQGVRVNCVAPGNIRTPMNVGQFAASPEYERSLEDKTPLGRIGETEDIAAAVVFLASPAAKFVNGASWLVDGGWAAQ
jgi:glucose 1-dehydrogenase